MKIYDNQSVRNQVLKYQLNKQYEKACNCIKRNEFRRVLLKMRKPKSEGVYQFRISKKYRALAIKEDGILYVYKITDHQD